LLPGNYFFSPTKKTKKRSCLPGCQVKNYRNVSGYVELNSRNPWSASGHALFRLTASVPARSPSRCPGGSQSILGQRLAYHPPAGRAHAAAVCGERYSKQPCSEACCSNFRCEDAEPKLAEAKIIDSHGGRNLQSPLRRSQPRPLRRSPPHCPRLSIRKLHCILPRLCRFRLSSSWACCAGVGPPRIFGESRARETPLQPESALFLIRRARRKRRLPFLSRQEPGRSGDGVCFESALSLRSQIGFSRGRASAPAPPSTDRENRSAQSRLRLASGTAFEHCYSPAQLRRLAPATVQIPHAPPVAIKKEPCAERRQKVWKHLKFTRRNPRP